MPENETSFPSKENKTGFIVENTFFVAGLQSNKNRFNFLNFSTPLFSIWYGEQFEL